MKSLDIIIRNGGQEAVDAVAKISGRINEMLPRWIPVGERLPNESEHPDGVLVWQAYSRDIYEAHDSHHVAEYRHNTGEWREFVESDLIANVTHWMPLPSPPTE